MRKSKIIIVLVMLMSLSCKSQVPQKPTFQVIKDSLVTFMLRNGDFNAAEAEKYRSGEKSLSLSGVLNNHSVGTMINGMYSFGTGGTHTRSYFLLIENEKFIVLNITNRDGLDTAIKNTLDFGERNKICVDITSDYIQRLVRVYYSINKNPNNRTDINCVKGLSDIKKLP